MSEADKELESLLGETKTADAELDELLSSPSTSFKFKTEEEKMSPSRAFGLGARQGITFEFGDEAAALARSLPEKQLGGQDNYRKYLEEERGKLRQAEIERPYYKTGGEVVGSLGTSIYGGAASQIPKMPKVGGAIAGGVEGGLTALGMAESKDKAPAGDIGTAVLIGSIFGKAGEKIGSLLDPATRAKKAEQTATKTFLADNKAFVRKLENLGFIEPTREGYGGKIQRQLLRGEPEEKMPPIITGAKTAQEVVDDISARKVHYGQIIGDIQESIDNFSAQGSVIGETVADRIRKERDLFHSKINNEFPDDMAEKVWDRLDAEIERYQNMGLLTFKQAQGQKSRYFPQKLKRGEQEMVTITPVEREVKSILYNAITGAMNDTTDQIEKLVRSMDPQERARYPELENIFGRYKKYKDYYATYANAERATKDFARRKSTNKAGPSLTDSIRGAGGMGLGGYLTYQMTGDPTAGLVGGYLTEKGLHKVNEFSRTRGAALGASTNQKIANVMNKVSGTRFLKPLYESLKRGNDSFVLTHQILLQQNPEYRKLVEDEEK